MSRNTHDFAFRGSLKTLQFPCIMGIINITNDSFYSGSRISDDKKLLETAVKMHQDGACIIDIGAVSTRPGAKLPGVTEEADKLIPAIQAVRKCLPGVLISVDTFRAEIARIAADEGADIINDISGGTMDKNMFSTIAAIHLPYILMHIQGTPENMHMNPVYDYLMNDINYFFAQQIHKAQNEGVHDILIDPGFGFGKTIHHNFELLKKLELLKMHKKPMLIGISRKSMIYKTLKTNPEDALTGTIILNTIALMKGADILRVHDVREAREIIQLTERIL